MIQLKKIKTLKKQARGDSTQFTSQKNKNNEKQRKEKKRNVAKYGT